MNKTILYAFLAAVILAPLVVFSEPVTRVMIDLEQKYSRTASSAASSTTTLTGTAFGFDLYASGSTMTYTIHYTTGIFPSGQVKIASSPVISIPAGSWYYGRFEAIATDPTLVVHGFNTAATHYVILSGGSRLQ